VQAAKNRAHDETPSRQWTITGATPITPASPKEVARAEEPVGEEAQGEDSLQLWSESRKGAAAVMKRDVGRRPVLAWKTCFLALRARIAIGALKALEIRQRNKKIQSRKQGQA
jgi:hypothetical protein